MKDIVLTLFGVYEPVTTSLAVTSVVDGIQVTEIVQSVASGAAGIDWPWMIGALLFAIVLYSLFRMIGVVLGA